MKTSSHRHWITVAWPEWGHCRSALNLSARLVNTSTTVLRITFLTHHSMAVKAEKELQRLVSDDGFGTSILQNLVVIGLGAVKNSKVIQYGKFESWYHGHQFLEAVIESWPIIHPRHAGCLEVQGRILSCDASGKTCDLSVLPEPTVVINDMFAAPVADHIRRLEKHNNVKVKLLMWFSSDISRFNMHTGNNEHIGTGKWATSNIQDCNKQCIEGQEKYAELSRRFSKPCGSIVRTPGLPEMFDYEFNPCNFPAPGVLFESLAGTRRQALSLADGCVVASSVEYQPDAVRACKEYFEGDLKKPVYCIGPPVPKVSKTQAAKGPGGPEDGIRFMDCALSTHGRQSVVLISFGTCYFPWHRPEQFVMLLRTLLSAKKTIPFIYSTASSSMFKEGQLDKDLSNQLAIAQEKGLCYGSNWLPQREILQHPAMGVFVSHCGFNSACEANAFGVPIIAWPLVGDQPGNAAYQSNVLNVGWELFHNKNHQALRLFRASHSNDSEKNTSDKSALALGYSAIAFQKELERILLQESRPGNPVFKDKKANAVRLSRMLKDATSPNGHAERELQRLGHVDYHPASSFSSKDTVVPLSNRTKGPLLDVSCADNLQAVYRASVTAGLIY